MFVAQLRRVGGSVMLAVPPLVLSRLHLSVGDKVSLDLHHDEIVMKPARPSYTLDELLAVSDYSSPKTREEREWINAPAVGKEW
ncbi:MAG: antitoxin [Burkholderiales bacterium]|jgi:antitoxin ChpS|nr:antitoxin [Burkholderiales bacterium]